jgi:hypothetical protein
VLPINAVKSELTDAMEAAGGREARSKFEREKRLRQRVDLDSTQHLRKALLVSGCILQRGTDTKPIYMPETVAVIRRVDSTRCMLAEHLVFCFLLFCCSASRVGWTLLATHRNYTMHR